MKCKCGKEMSCIAGWGDEQRTDIGYNLYVCDSNDDNGGCGIIYKETYTEIECKRNLWMPPTLSSLENNNEIDKWVKDYEAGFIS